MSVAASLILVTLAQPPAASAEGIPIEVIQSFLVRKFVRTPA